MDENKMLEAVSPWIQMPLEIWEPLMKDSTPVVFPRGKYFFHQDDIPDAVYIVVSGCVRVTAYKDDGMETRFYIIEQGGLCGESACLMGTNHMESALSIIDTTAYRIDVDVLFRALKENPKVSASVIQSLCRKQHVLMRQVMDLSFYNPAQRAARMLLHIYEQYGQVNRDMIRIDWRLTNQNLANMINASRVTVNKVMGMLIEEGILKKEGNYYQLLDYQRLKKKALYPEHS